MQHHARKGAANVWLLSFIKRVILAYASQAEAGGDTPLFFPPGGCALGMICFRGSLRIVQE